MRDRLPNLLVIGAMKCGTSSIYAELNRHPDIYFPQNKEPNGLRAIHEKDDAGFEAYKTLYRGRQERYLGDASTGYTKFPVRQSVAGTAVSTLGSTTKIIYVTRDPIYRAERHVSHHIGNGVAEPNILDVRKNPEYAAISAYEMQLSFWREYFDNDKILQIDFEAYKHNRAKIVQDMFDFLDLDAAELLSAAKVNANRGQSRRSAYRSPVRSLVHGSLYGAVRETLPRPVRRTLANLLLPKARVTDFKFTQEEAEFIQLAVHSLNQLSVPSEADVKTAFDNISLQHIRDQALIS